MINILRSVYHKLFTIEDRNNIRNKYYATTWNKFLNKNQTQNNEYALVRTDEDLFYIGGGMDYAGVMGNMVREGVTHSASDMKEYYRLTEKYSKSNDSKANLFIDVGLNIGTTSIYFKKKLDQNIKVIGFEPDSKNYRIARSNFILNSMSDEDVINHMGVGEKRDKMELFQHPENPGGNSFINSPTDERETVDVCSLDEYAKENNIDAKNIKYIWIDTEGFEPYVLFGAERLIKDSFCPVYIEFNPQVYSTIDGLFERYITFLDNYFKGYISIEESKNGSEKIHSIEDLYLYKDDKLQYGDIVLIK